MSELKGRLESLSLIDILKLIQDKSHTGRLSLKKDAQQASLVFDKGQLVFTGGLSDAGRMGRRLANRGEMDRRELLGWKLDVRRSGRKTLQDFLPALDTEKPVFREIIETALQDELMELLGWESGEFEFVSEAAEVPEALRLDVTSQGLMAIAEEQVKLWQDIRQRMPSDGRVAGVTDFTRESFQTGETLTEQEWVVLASIDGRRSLKAVATLAGRSWFETCRAALRLMDQGYLQWREKKEEISEPVQACPAQAPSPQAKGFFKRLTVPQEKVSEGQAGPVELVDQVVRFENRLLEVTSAEAGESFSAGQFVQDGWPKILEEYPLVDWLSAGGGRIYSETMQQKFSAWDPGEVGEDIKLDVLDALRDLVEWTYAILIQTAGEKKALQLYRREFEQIFRAEPSGETSDVLALLGLAR